MTIEYKQADERPAWRATVTDLNGTPIDDLSSGFTFQVKVVKDGITTLTKTTGITGAIGGVVTVAWAPNELDITAGVYRVQLKAQRIADLYEWTIEDSLLIRQRY